jgi:Uma2 family endonuclease
VVLHNLSWQTYDRLLGEVSECSSLRLTYDRGTLEITSPSEEHEELNRSLAYLVEALVTELDLDSRSLGSATFRREDLDRGFEPDSCFYIQNASRVAGKKKLDLATDPPPDLVVEVELTSSVVDKLDIYSNLGVPEVWRCSASKVRILRLVSGLYEDSPSSLAFPFLTAEKLSELLREGRSVRRSQWIRTLRAWLASVRSKDA